MPVQSPKADVSHNLYTILTSRTLKQPEKPFLVVGESETITFGRMADTSMQVAGWLRACGVTKGDRVLVQLDKSPASVALYLGCLRVGAIYVPLNTAYTEKELDYFLEDADPAMVVASPGMAAASAPFDGHRHVIGKSVSDAPWSAAPQDVAVEPVTPNDPAAILYTSGTTGRSKGAVLTHENLSSNALVLHEAWRWSQGDVLLHALPIYHAHGLFVALHGALLNASTVLFHERFEVRRVIDDLGNATVFMGVPTFYTRLLEEPDFQLGACGNIRLFISGSAPLLESTFEQFEQRTGHRILERYGMTEALMVTSNPYDGPRKAGTVGLPLAGIDVGILDERGSKVGVGDPGILHIKGPNLFSGYWRNPQKTAEDHTADGHFISGDIAVYDTCGYIRIVGRAKDLIISGGFNVYPKEIELAIDAIPGVAESAVIGIPHPDFGEGVVAIVVSDPGSKIDLSAMRATLAESLAAFKRPKGVVVIDELPRNAMGKVQKAALRERYAGLFASSETSIAGRRA